MENRNIPSDFENYDGPIYKNTHGGARKGSGRKSKPPTATISFRVPKDRSEELKLSVGSYLKELTDIK